MGCAVVADQGLLGAALPIGAFVVAPERRSAGSGHGVAGLDPAGHRCRTLERSRAPGHGLLRLGGAAPPAATAWYAPAPLGARASAVRDGGVHRARVRLRPDVEPSRAVAGTRVAAARPRGGAGRRARADPCPTRRTGARPRALSRGSDAVRGACADGRAA